jgi:uncharacterized protein
VHRREGKLIVSATDVVGLLHCGHLTNLELQADAGLVHKPSQREDPEVLLLQRRGGAHEQRYIDMLEAAGREVVRLSADWDRSYEERAAETEELMRRGVDVIYQATVFDGRWVGHPDFLLRRNGPRDGRQAVASLSRVRRSLISGFDSQAGAEEPLSGESTGLGWDWHYEVADTKLAHSAKASALLQIASYTEQIERIQDVQPERVYVVTGGKEAVEHPFRTAEMLAYYRRAKARFEELLAGELDASATYPEPVEHCSVCRWYRDFCWRQWREDDALNLVANIRRDQRQLLALNDIVTTKALAALEQPYDFVAKRAHRDGLEKVVLQARLQHASADAGTTLYELLQPERDGDGALVADRGLSALPPPSAGDLFFDIEGDPFAYWEGLEYLFGVWEVPQGDGLWDQDGYTSIWALDRDQERDAFQQVMDLFMDRLQRYPDMHIYHYAPYEPTALKRLAGQHAMLEEELDQLLRGRVFVDLYRAVRQGVRVGAESYSIKKLEPLYGYAREIELRDANSSIVEFEHVLEVGDPDGSIKEQIRLYNRDDCISTQKLRDWLEARRAEAEKQFEVTLPRPSAVLDAPPEEFTERQARVKALEQRLTASIPDDPAQQMAADKATWLLRHLLDWHRRENKASWWRFYELMSLSEDELLDEAEPIAHLEFVEVIEPGGKVRGLDHRYRYPPQEHKVDVGSDVHDPEITEGETRTGTVVAINEEERTVDIRRPRSWEGRHPESIVPRNILGAKAQQDALLRIGEWVAEHGIDSDADEWRAARGLLLRLPPRAGQEHGTSLTHEGESGSAAALRLATQLEGTTLAIQGPPGSGKTWVGARMILELVRAGKRVGVTANSHKVITNLLDAVGRAADDQGMTVRGMQKVEGDDGCKHEYVKCTGSNSEVVEALTGGGVDVVGGTAWLWAREDMSDLIDTLFVDEAGQMSLANVVAMSGSARNIVLLGDPQQLEQPIQGSHPDGAERSALGHFLGDRETVEPERGIFFEKTWRLCPQICSYTSELFYEGRLEPVAGLERQAVVDGPWAGSGLRWVAVEHDGRTNESEEEARVVADIWRSLVGTTWVDKDGQARPISAEEIVIVSPFNAHRLRIQELLGPSARVGTVDKFQGQEAPVSIYTMATSRPEDAPRGMAFLYSLNRLNVATSRAKALAIVVASPKLLDVVPRTPDQLRMANGLAAFVELAGGGPS